MNYIRITTYTDITVRVNCFKIEKNIFKKSCKCLSLRFACGLICRVPCEPWNLKATCIIWSALDMIATYFISNKCSFHHFLHELSVLRRHGTYVQLAHDLCVFYLGILINSRASSGFLHWPACAVRSIAKFT